MLGSGRFEAVVPWPKMTLYADNSVWANQLAQISRLALLPVTHDTKKTDLWGNPLWLHHVRIFCLTRWPIRVRH